MTVLHIDSIRATRLYGQFGAGAAGRVGIIIPGDGSHSRSWILKSCHHCECDLCDRLCRAPGCQNETFVYRLDGDQEAVNLCDRHHDHCAAPACDRAATFTSTRSGLLYCRLEHLDASERIR